jgi:hypothetical protein
MEVCLETDKEQTRGFGFEGCLLGFFFTVRIPVTTFEISSKRWSLRQCFWASRGEDTKRNLKHVKEPLGGAISLNNVQDGVLAQPEPMAYFPVRLTFADEL